MPNIKELSFDEIALVSGGNANGQSYDERNNFGIGRAPVTRANNAGIGAIVSAGVAIAAGTGGVGIVAAAVGGAILSSLPSGSSSNNSGGGNWHDTNPGGMVGECRW